MIIRGTLFGFSPRHELYMHIKYVAEMAFPSDLDKTRLKAILRVDI